jgi:putative transposase
MTTKYRFRPADLDAFAYYHIVSRCYDRNYLLKAEEKAFLLKQMRRYEALHGVRVVTFCIMTNHFHMLVEVPPRPSAAGPMFTEASFLVHLENSLGHGKAEELRRLFEMYKDNGCEKLIPEIISGYEKRMFNISNFMQDVKQAFSVWYNKRVGRRGTLWEERFRSVLVEGAGEALATMAAYIDLNPVRAKIVEDPADYAWSGYGEAVAAGNGGAKARSGLAVVGRVLGAEGWEAVSAKYRLWLYGEGQEILPAEGVAYRAGFKLETIEAVHAAGGKLSRGQMLRIKVNYLTRGGIFGSAGFVNSVFASLRDRFGKTRKTGARKLKGVEAGDMRVLRDLQKGVG